MTPNEMLEHASGCLRHEGWEAEADAVDAAREALQARATTETLRERVRERLAEIITTVVIEDRPTEDAVDAILREFRLQPVAVGRVDAETGEVSQ